MLIRAKQSLGTIAVLTVRSLLLVLAINGDDAVIVLGEQSVMMPATVGGV
jgi:hypothetical protein